MKLVTNNLTDEKVMSMKKIFSVPLNPKLTPEQYQEFIQFAVEHKHLIYDIYFTSRIAPFSQDAMGDIQLHLELSKHPDHVSAVIPKEPTPWFRYVY